MKRSGRAAPTDPTDRSDRSRSTWRSASFPRLDGRATEAPHDDIGVSNTPLFDPMGPRVRCWVMAIDIRPFREADRSFVRDLTIAAFEGVSIDRNIDLRLGPIAGRDWSWRKARDVEQDIDLLGAEIAVAVDDRAGVVVGYITMQCDRETLIGWIHNLAVGAEAQGQGLGRRLLEHALAHFRAAGMTVAKIETLEQNPIGRHLYPSVGFVEVARQIHYAMPLGDRPAHVPRSIST
jgi:ribosomal protein S18 acetylase RimI-like enzyme